MNPDMINAAFEAGGALGVFHSCYRLYQDKQVRGVSPWAVALFAAWGLWNLFYYPHLGQWWSFAAGVMVMVGNTTWVMMAAYYSERKGG